MSDFQQAEADRRISQMVQVGVVAAIDGRRSRARVRIGDIETIELPITQLRMGGIRLYAMPTVCEQVMVFAPGGDMARAIVGPSIAAGNAPGDGDAAHAVLDMGSGELRITGDIVVTGDIRVTGGITTTGDVVADDVSLIGHVHGGVATGGSTTKEPVK